VDICFLFLASELSIEKKIYILDRQHAASQWGLQLIFRMHNSDPTPQGVENRNIRLWFKGVLTVQKLENNMMNIVYQSCKQ
jgi:hypothetical protein